MSIDNKTTNDRDELAEAVYETLYGLRLPEDEVPGVKSLFTSESVYAKIEDNVYRLREQLENNISPENYALIEQLVTQLYCIQKELCLQMYVYGARFGQKGGSC